MAAYKVCQTRIDAVEQALEEAPGTARAKAAEPPVQKPQGKSASAKTPGDEDIPF